MAAPAARAAEPTQKPASESRSARRLLRPAEWKPTWSVPAAMRAVRATIVIPSLFAITSKVIGDPQMALYATFGGFATLVVANFGGTRPMKAAAYLALAIAGSIAIVIGTLASSATWLAAVVTLPVVFVIFFAGVLGPTAASSTTALLFAYVLPVASAGGVATIGSRLEGWWLASAAATLAVLLLSPKSPGDRIRAAASALAAEIGNRVAAAARGAAERATDPAGLRAKKQQLLAAFTAAPYRPTGLGTADQALAGVVQVLDWGAAQAADAFDGHIDLTTAAPADRELLRAAAGVFADAAALLAGREASPDFDALEAARASATEYLRDLAAGGDEPVERMAAAQAVHAQTIAMVARNAALDALIVAGRADPGTVAHARRVWSGTEPTTSTRQLTVGHRPALATVISAAGLVLRHASLRSVWFANSLRGAVAIAAAVAVADLTGVQHGFWVVLGTLSVLRTNASGTGATALRALAGTVLGFAVGAALLAAIGTGQTTLWVVFPLAILVAAYATGTMPFTVGQAAFTIVIVVLFNLLVPIGWKVGLLRIEDVALGCLVSAVVGVLFWPRGAASLVGDDLADAFRHGAEYLTQAVDWALSESLVPPLAASAAVTAGLRLDDALRGFLAEQGSKKASKEDLWTLVNATQRLRLAATSLARLRHLPPPGVTDGPACVPLAGSDSYAGTPACVLLRQSAAALAAFYDQVAGEVGHPGREAPTLLPGPAITAAAVPRPRSAPPAHAPSPAGPRGAEPEAGHSPPLHPHLLWVQEHLHHLSQSAQVLPEPALRVSEARRRPWWR